MEVVVADLLVVAELVAYTLVQVQVQMEVQVEVKVVDLL